MLRAHLCVAVLAATVALPRIADACGGCFHPKDDAPSVVTDHRMALSVSKTQTVLWDQVRYQGNPKEFAWVLPVGPGARVELARDEFLSALDVATAPLISAPDFVCANGQRPGGSSAGCGGSLAPQSFARDPYDYGPDGGGGFQSTGDVTVVSQSVVGPYVSVIIRSTSGDAISKWLDDNGFAIPPEIAPTLASYVAQKLDFLALRLRPDAGVRAMQPVRVITPGADPTLPLRMVAAGTGANVGLLLYVIGEGRYEATSHPNAVVPLDALTWDATAGRSNYTELFTAAMAGGRWVTEYSGKGFGTIKYGYESACAGRPPVKVAVECPNDGGSDGGGADAGDPDAMVDGGDPDASDPDASDPDAASLDGGAVDGATSTDAAAPGCFVMRPACDFFDDDDVAVTGMHPTDVTVTRMRTTLPTQGLVDLRLGASSGSGVASRLQATKFSVTPTCPPADTSSSGGCACDTNGTARGAAFPVVFAAAALALLRRRRR